MLQSSCRAANCLSMSSASIRTCSSVVERNARESAGVTVRSSSSNATFIVRRANSDTTVARGMMSGFRYSIDSPKIVSIWGIYVRETRVAVCRKYNERVIILMPQKLLLRRRFQRANIECDEAAQPSWRQPRSNAVHSQPYIYIICRKRPVPRRKHGSTAPRPNVELSPH